MMPNRKYTGILNQMVLGTFFFAHSLHAGLQSDQSSQTIRNHWTDKGPSKAVVIFYYAGFSAKGHILLVWQVRKNVLTSSRLFVRT